MTRESNLIDLSKITPENFATYNERIKFEIPRQWLAHNKIKRRVKLCKNCGEENAEYDIAYEEEIICKCRKCGKKYSAYYCPY